MDDFKKIEVEIAKRYGAITRGTKKSIGDFLINEDTSKAVNVKSNNVDKNNYSPNIISAKRLLNWLKK
jgi:F420-0:gamma-glutamyl ligase-like protein